MRIIPAIDIIGGKCVRLSRGDYATQIVYNENPLEVAKAFEANGIRHLHLVDLDGAKSRHIVNHRVLEAICTHTDLHVDFGGGLKSDEDVRIAFDSGAAQVTGGSVAVNAPETFARWLAQYGSDKIILGADGRNRKVATSGWLETAEIDVVDFIVQHAQNGVRYVICTDIDKDGMLQGPSNQLYRDILDRTDVDLIASGGVSSADDLVRLREIGCEGAIVGKAFYEGRIGLEELRPYLGR